MKKMIMLAAVAVCLNASAGVGATTNWVVRYVAQAISNSLAGVTANTSTVSTGSVTTVYSGTPECPITMTIEMPDVPTLVVYEADANAAAMGVTNSAKWAWSEDNGQYERAGFDPIQITASNLIWQAVGSTARADGGMKFDNGTNWVFSVGGSLATAKRARIIRGD